MRRRTLGDTLRALVLATPFVGAAARCLSTGADDDAGLASCSFSSNFEMIPVPDGGFGTGGLHGLLRCEAQRRSGLPGELPGSGVLVLFLRGILLHNRSPTGLAHRHGSPVPLLEPDRGLFPQGGTARGSIGGGVPLAGARAARPPCSSATSIPCLPRGPRGVAPRPLDQRPCSPLRGRARRARLRSKPSHSAARRGGDRERWSRDARGRPSELPSGFGRRAMRVTPRSKWRSPALQTTRLVTPSSPGRLPDGRRRACHVPPACESPMRARKHSDQLDREAFLARSRRRS